MIWAPKGRTGDPATLLHLLLHRQMNSELIQNGESVVRTDSLYDSCQYFCGCRTQGQGPALAAAQGQVEGAGAEDKTPFLNTGHSSPGCTGCGVSRRSALGQVAHGLGSSRVHGITCSLPRGPKEGLGFPDQFSVCVAKPAGLKSERVSQCQCCWPELAAGGGCPLGCHGGPTSGGVRVWSQLPAAPSCLSWPF